MPMDIELDPTQQDIMSDVGYANLLVHTLSLSPGSGKFTAPVCSTWVFMSDPKLFPLQ